MRCSWPAPCDEPAAEPYAFGPMLRYCFEHEVEVGNNRARMFSMSRDQQRTAVIEARYMKDDNPFKPISAEDDRNARAAEQRRREGAGAQ